MPKHFTSLQRRIERANSIEDLASLYSEAIGENSEHVDEEEYFAAVLDSVNSKLKYLLETGQVKATTLYVHPGTDDSQAAG